MRSRQLRTAVFIGLPLIATALCTLESLRGPVDIDVTSSAVTRGDIVHRLAVSGVLQPMNTVDVSSPIAGTVAEVDVDLNASVHAGQVLLRLEGSQLQTELDEARSTLTEARAALAASRDNAARAADALNRAERLAAQRLIADLDLDSARTAVVQADTEVESANTRVDDATADVRKANAGLQQTVITAPVDGVIVSRNASTGAAIAADESGAALFRIAPDFRSMQVLTDIDGSDIASMPIGAPASFHVNAYPHEQFEGHVAEIRYDGARDQATMDGVTPRPDVEGRMPSALAYPVIITVENPAEKLRPGMTALVSLDGARRERATRIPNAALSFLPSPDLLAATHQKDPGPPVENLANIARVWAYDGTEFTPIAVHIGLSDDHWTELLSGPLEPGTTLVTKASKGDAEAASN